MASPTKQNSINADSISRGEIGAVQSNVTDAVTSHSITDAAAEIGATSQAELEGVFDAFGTKINSILDVLEWHGLMTGSTTDNRGNCIVADDLLPMLSTRQSAITDLAATSLTDADGSFGATTQAELEGYFDAIAAVVNSALDNLGKHGLITDTTNNPAKQNCLYADRNGATLINGSRQANIADAVVAHSITDADTNLGAVNEAQLEGFYDALGTKVNAILDVLETHGLMIAS